MASIGSFGRDKNASKEEREPLTFEFYGTEFEAADNIPFLSFAAYAEISQRGVSFADAEGLAAVYNLMRSCLAEKRTLTEERNNETVTREINQWATFQEVCSVNKVQLDELFELIAAIQDGIASRPFEPASDSSPGQLGTGSSSNSSTSSRGTRRSSKPENVTLAELEGKEDAAVGGK